MLLDGAITCGDLTPKTPNQSMPSFAKAKARQPANCDSIRPPRRARWPRAKHSGESLDDLPSYDYGATGS
jgi:hypothetical protein